MIKFTIFFEDSFKEFNYESNNTILNLKSYIINLFNLKIDYIDLDILNEIPIRGLGKFNLDKGILLRTFDNYKLNQWNLENKEIKIKIIEIKDYKPEVLEKIELSTQKIKSVYKLESEEDFPSL